MKKDITIEKRQVALTLIEGIKYARVPTPVCGGETELNMKLIAPNPRFYTPGDIAPRPTILTVTCGAWAMCSLAAQVPDAAYLARFGGFNVALIDIRVYDQALFPAHIEDVKTAVRFLRAHAEQYFIDPERIAAYGGSSSGHLVTLAGMNEDRYVTEAWPGFSSDVQAVVDNFGPMDFNEHIKKYHFGAGLDPRTGRPMTEADVPESKVIGGPVSQNPDKAFEINPINHINPRTAPVLILQGTADTAVPRIQSDLLYDALTRAGQEPELYLIEGAGHGTPEFSQPELLDIIIEFLHRKLR